MSRPARNEKVAGSIPAGGPITLRRVSGHFERSQNPPPT